MPNPIFNQVKQGNSQASTQKKGFASPDDFMSQFNQFRNNFRGNPQEKVQQLLSSGQMSQQQFQKLQGMANMLQRFFVR